MLTLDGIFSMLPERDPEFYLFLHSVIYTGGEKILAEK